MKRDLDFLFEVGALRRIPRMWVHFFGPGMANNAEHSFRVAWIALMLARKEKKGDIAKILMMALLHDVDEGRTGDLDRFMRKYVERDKRRAIGDILEGTLVEGELLTVWKEYEERKSIEAKIVKDADLLEADMELAEMASMGNEQAQKWLKDAKRQEPKWHTASAKKMAAEIRKADAARWYLNRKP